VHHLRQLVHSLTHSAAVPEKVDEAIKEFRYVNYSLLTRSGRRRVTKDRESSIVSDVGVELHSKVMSPEGEGEISPLDWTAVAEAVESQAFHYHGAARSDPLKAHHRNVLKVANMYDWGLAQIYDQETREPMAKDPRHDPSILNRDIITQASIFRKLEQMETSLLAHQSQPIQNIVPPLHPPPSPSNTPTTSHSTKRFNTYDKPSRQPRSARSKSKRPRRGATGHASAAYGP